MSNDARDLQNELRAAEKEAKTLLAAGKHAEALQRVDGALAALSSAGVSLPPGKIVLPGVMLCRAVALAGLGRTDEAIVAARAAADDPAVAADGFLERKLREEALDLAAGECARAGRFDDAILAARDLVGLARSDRDRIERLVLVASFYARRGCVALARRRMEEAQAIDPKDAALDVAAAWIRFANGDRAGAKLDLERLVDRRRRPEIAKAALAALETAPDPGPAPDATESLRAAEEHLAAGRAAHAELAAELATAADPASSAAFTVLARARLAAGRPAEAVAAFDDAVQRDGKSPAAHAGRARALAAIGKLEDAERAAARALELEPRLGEEIAAWHLERGNAGAAERAIAPLLELDPPRSAMLLGGRCAAALGHHADAEARFRRALEREPQDAAARAGLAAALLSTGRLDEAIAEAEAVVGRDPAGDGAPGATGPEAAAGRDESRAEALGVAVRALGRAGRVDDALRRAAGIAVPAQRVALEVDVLAAAGRADDARARFVEATAAHPADVELARGFAKHLADRGESDGAKSWERTAAGLALLAGGDAAGALAAFEAAAKEEPAEPRHVIDCALAMAAKGTGLSGVRRAQDSVASSNDPALLRRFAEVCAVAKLPHRAKDVLEKAVARAPELGPVYEAWKAATQEAPGTPAAPTRERPARDPAKIKVGDLMRGFFEADKAGTTNRWLRGIDEAGGLPALEQSRIRGKAYSQVADALLRAGRHGEAMTALDRALETSPAGRGDRTDALLVRARALGRSGRLHDAILTALEALTQPVLDGVRAEIHGYLGIWLARIGALSVARGCLDVTRRLSNGGAGMELVGHALLAEDERLEARRAFLEAAERTGPNDGDTGREGALGAAITDALLGDFAAARERLSAITPREDDAWFRFRMAAVAAQIDQPDLETEHLGKAIEIAPAGDLVPHCRLRLAELALSAGRRDEALSSLDALAKGGASPVAALAERLAAKLRANAGAKKRRLSAFPTVAQKRSHCGPAALELVLRYFGGPGEQSAIASVVRKGRGTPSWLLSQYLGDQGFVVRRCAAPLATLRELVDAGVPVLVDEEYSMSSHVAVVVGYDDERELLLVQDPMTHRIRETPYERLDARRGLFGHAAIVAAPAGHPAAPAVERLADDPALLAAEEGFRALSEQALDRAMPAFERATTARAELPLGWLGKLETAAGALADGDTPEERDLLRRLVAEARERFPEAEWPHQHEGRLALCEGRIADAMAAFEAASRRDPDDADNLAWVGNCHAALGRAEPASAAWAKALDASPSQVDALTGLALRAIDARERLRALHFATTALSLAPERAVTHETFGIIAELDDRLDDALAAFARAIERAPRRASAKVARARCLFRLGKRDDALRSLDEALGDAEGSPRARLDVARVFLEQGDPQRAHDALAPARALDPENVSVLAVLGACLFRLGRPDEAEPLLREALARAAEYTWARNELVRGLVHAKKGDKVLALAEEAIAREPDVLQHRVDEMEGLFAVGRADDGLARARALVGRIGPHPDLVARIARLAEQSGRRPDARRVFEDAIDRTLDLHRPGLALMRGYAELLTAIGEKDAAYAWARAVDGYTTLGRPEALELFEELVARSPGEPRFEHGAILALEALDRDDEAFARSKRLVEAGGWKDPHHVRRHGELGWRLRIFKGSPVPAFEEALERNPDDVGLVAALVEEQEDKGHGDSHFARHWKEKLAGLRAAVNRNGAVPV